MIEYKVKRSSRKSVAIKVTEKGEVFVMCPLKFSNKKIEQIVQEKTNWITSVLLNIEQKKEDYKEFYDYNKIMFLGQEYSVEYFTNYIKIGDIIYKSRKNYNKKQLLKKLLTEQANSFILNRLDQLSDKFNLPYRSAKIISARKKWGSCDNLRNININFRLVMLPVKCIDYVLIHELCHTKFMNHSLKFWNEVEKFAPKYNDMKQILKQKSFTLELF